MTTPIALCTLLLFTSVAAGPRPLPPDGQSRERTEGQGKDVVVGRAAFYDAYPMEQVLRNRGMVRPPGYAGLASTPWCNRIGSTVWASLYNPVLQTWGPYEKLLAVDCSRPGADQRRHLCVGQPKGCVPLVVEVDRATATRAGFAREGKTSAKVRYGDGHYVFGD